jgi:hypothetical protein
VRRASAGALVGVRPAAARRPAAWGRVLGGGNSLEQAGCIVLGRQRAAVMPRRCGVWRRRQFFRHGAAPWLACGELLLPSLAGAEQHHLT